METPPKGMLARSWQQLLCCVLRLENYHDVCVQTYAPFSTPVIIVLQTREELCNCAGQQPLHGAGNHAETHHCGAADAHQPLPAAGGVLTHLLAAVAPPLPGSAPARLLPRFGLPPTGRFRQPTSFALNFKIIRGWEVTWGRCSEQ